MTVIINSHFRDGTINKNRHKGAQLNRKHMSLDVFGSSRETEIADRDGLVECCSSYTGDL